MHGNMIAAPINASPHDLLVLLKEATGLTIIPSPTVQHSLMEVSIRSTVLLPPP
jgi:hypothetical protein